MGYTHERLIFELTNLDRQESARERRPNIHRLGLYFNAARDMADMVAAGSSPEAAFAEVFTPARGMHRVARNLGLSLDVQRGQWILPAAERR